MSELKHMCHHQGVLLQVATDVVAAGPARSW